MKQIAQYQDGRLELQEVPKPTAPSGGILVRVTHSVISTGTERMKVEQAQMNLLQKAKARPDQVRKVLQSARTLGWRATAEKVRNRLESPTPLGYSAAGVVDAVDTENTRFRVGDRVACGGAECAFHAEYIAVPDKLAAGVPDGVENWQAAYTTIVSIALQTVRQLEPTLGERALVIGQGLVGLLVTGLLRADGARVMAVDLDAAREPFARAVGAESFLLADHGSVIDQVHAWTDGYGVDAVILATGTQSNAPTELAVEALRDRGRIVVVGNTKVELLWRYAYEKEIDIRYARSYGPGRYEPAYEWGGTDYPIGYVRWTEQRNFDACLHLMKTGALDLAALTTRRVPFTAALDVYRTLLSPDSQDVGVVLEYETDARLSAAVLRASEPPQVDLTRGAAPSRLQAAVGRVNVIGAGNFARTMLLPHLKRQVPLGVVVNNTSLSANHVKTKFGFSSAATDAAGLFEPPASGPPGASKQRPHRRRHCDSPPSACPVGPQGPRGESACVRREAALPDARGTGRHRCRGDDELGLRPGRVQSPLRTCQCGAEGAPSVLTRPEDGELSRGARQARSTTLVRQLCREWWTGARRGVPFPRLLLLSLRLEARARTCPEYLAPRRAAALPR